MSEDFYDNTSTRCMRILENFAEKVSKIRTIAATPAQLQWAKDHGLLTIAPPTPPASGKKVTRNGHSWYQNPAVQAAAAEIMALGDALKWGDMTSIAAKHRANEYSVRNAVARLRKQAGLPSRLLSKPAPSNLPKRPRGRPSRFANSEDRHAFQLAREQERYRKKHPNARPYQPRTANAAKMMGGREKYLLQAKDFPQPVQQEGAA